MSSHEDIRYKVISDLRTSILSAIGHIRNSKPQVYTRLKGQLTEYLNLINRKEDVPLIIKNEKIIEGVGRPDIEVFGGRILIEVKVNTSEFEDGFEQLSRYVKFCPYAEYALLTNYDEWEYYRVKKGRLKSSKIESLVKMIEETILQGIQIGLSTENVKNLFNPMTLFEKELSILFKNYHITDSALFRAYRNIIKKLYEKASDEDIETLFIKHTLIQMIVSSCLTASSKRRPKPRRACSGVELGAEIVLPYLNWWNSLDRKSVV